MTSYLPRFDAEFAEKLTKRSKTFRLMLELLERMPGPISIVETGCVRELGCWDGDGCSTVLFNDFVDQAPGRHLLSIEINEATAKLASENCPRAFVRIDDAVKALAGMPANEVISLLYLDSFDFDPANPHPSSLHHLKELAAAQKNLRPGSIICVDDNHPDGTGKGAYVRDYLHNLGIEPIADDYQIVWVWK